MQGAAEDQSCDTEQAQPQSYNISIPPQPPPASHLPIA